MVTREGLVSIEGDGRLCKKDGLLYEETSCDDQFTVREDKDRGEDQRGT